MSSAKEYLQVKFLKTLEPLGSLSIDKLEELANKSQVEELPAGRVIFRQGEKDSRTTYLLSGQLEMQVTGNPRTEILKAKSPDARYPIAQEWPRPSTCRSKTNVILLHIDSNLLEILLSDDTSGLYEVTEIGVEDDENEWMLRFLQSAAFLHLPTDNIQKLLVQLEEVSYQAGDVIIRQGESDPWYYIVKSGRCSVARRPAPSAEEVRLAILGPGDGFGEEALITHGKRNATVTAKEACVLMRLDTHSFHTLLVQPLLQQIDHSSMMEKVKTGAALIDVRSNKEFSDNGIKGALNIPLSMLRVKAKDLNATREHIVYCNDANLSSAAAFLLAQQGLQVYVLQGGLNAQQKTFSPAPVNNEPTAQSASATTAKPTVAENIPVLNSIVNDKAFDEHKRKAKEQAKLANEAESARKQAEEKSSQLREKADALRAQADHLASKTAHAQAEKAKADAEIQRIKDETIKQRDQILANAKLEIEREKERTKQTEQKVSRLKDEAEQARRRAEEELARIRREAESVNAKQTRLENDLKHAEEEKQRAARTAEVARIVAKQEAEKVRAEADAIRQQALAEAERLKREMENRKARMEAEEASRHQAAIEEARRKAEAAIAEAARAAEEARRQAELEAQTIRKQALEEAERLRLQIEREKQQNAEATARAKAEEQLRLKTFEQIQRQAMETARLEAEKAAEAIRREALEEANRLRAEMESTRQLVENQARLAQARMEEEAGRRLAEEESLTRAAEEAARRAAEEAERRRAEDARRRAEEARYLAEQQERRRSEEAQRQAREEAERIQAEQARQRKTEAEHRREETRRLVEQQARREREDDARREQQAKKARDAMRQAAELKQRMAANNARRQQADEFLVSTGSGPKLAKAKVHIVKDKTILEGEEDIFVFKAPSERPPTRDEAEKLLRQAESLHHANSGKELPSFDIEYADEAPAVKTPEHDSQFSDSIISDLGSLTAQAAPSPGADDEFAFKMPGDINAQQKHPRRKRSLITLAASVVVMIAVSILVITRPSYIDVDNIAGWNDDTGARENERGLAAMRTSTAADTRSATEERAKNEAEAEFRQLLSKWRNTQKPEQAPE